MLLIPLNENPPRPGTLGSPLGIEESIDAVYDSVGADYIASDDLRSINHDSVILDQNVVYLLIDHLGQAHVLDIHHGDPVSHHMRIQNLPQLPLVPKKFLEFLGGQLCEGLFRGSKKGKRAGA